MGLGRHSPTPHCYCVTVQKYEAGFWAQVASSVPGIQLAAISLVPLQSSRMTSAECHHLCYRSVGCLHLCTKLACRARVLL